MRHQFTTLPLSTKLILGLTTAVLLALLVRAAPLFGCAVAAAIVWLVKPEVFRPSWWRSLRGRLSPRGR